MEKKGLRGLLLPIVLAVVGILLVFGVFSSKVNAASDSAIYNGTVTDLDSNNNSSRTVNGLVHKVWMTAQNTKNGQVESSNYGAAQPGVTHNFLLKNGNYTDLHLHLKITNSSNETTVNFQAINSEWLVLPINKNFFGNAATDQVTYSGTTPITPDPSNVKLMYTFDNRTDRTDGSSIQPEEWSHLSAIVIQDGNSLGPGQSIELDVPLRVTPDADGNTKTFTFANMSYNNWYYTAIQNWARVASPVELNYRQPGYQGVFVAGEKAANGELNFASDVQKYFPKITNSLGAIGYDNTNSFIDRAPDDPDNVFYTGGLQIVHLDKIPSVNGNGLLIDDLHNNGYSFAISPDNDYGHKIGTEDKTYIYSIANNKPFSNVLKDGSDASGQTYNNELLGHIGLQVQQFIGASDKTIPLKGTWSAYDGATFYDTNQTKLTTVPDGVSYVVKKVDANNNETDVTSKKIDTTKNGVYRVTYTYVVNNGLTVKKTVTITVGSGNPTPTPTTPSTSGTSGNGSTASNTGNNTGNAGNGSGSTTGSTTTTTTKPSTSTSPNVAVKGEAVYAIKKIGLYKSTNFTKANRIAWYSKQKRTNRPMFVVTGYKRNSNGTLRYKVRDVNHGRKTAGKTGYITASQKYVVPVYYASVPKSKKITVIAKKGVNAYKSAKLTGKVKCYKKGTHLRVKKLVKHNLTTRYQLTNGKYVTTNKKLIIGGDY
ncbi:DUF5776 domain-containing protein [Lentilactobacillus farraginis]|uniref:DUF5776 domain-containing protein n=1 Tax=Lentilactobacillus farraginis DSM 18382 = JCM 14108 TaxID=1423743 RepID=X0PKH4_9LACO|nr:DUF5776 domain-containing protein [Lentilactobacillus farraginis]KRM03957.1 hypothetical protein FD41_GL000996 [Lentilactobacillus farraginis DSM 18382 = JCM 14108]GAF37156.1 hypothetical protein JCM14108_2171 [Lentilactobacillus farraginis DSM 18382 = JCM 14108]